MAAFSDYDPAVLTDLKPAVARLLVRQFSTEGTGFLISGNRVLTCAHVVKDLEPGERLACRFYESTEELSATVESKDAQADIAVLRLESEPVGVRPLELASDEQVFGSWIGYGYPAFTEGVGVPLSGRLVDPSVRDRDGRAAVHLSAEMLTGEAVSLGGFSGSPIVYGRRVVGMLYRVLGAKGDWSATHFGLLYALPVRALRAVLGGGSAPVPGNATPENEGNVRKLAQLLAELRSSGRAGEVLAARDRLLSAGLLTSPVVQQAAEMLLDMGAPKDALDVLADEPGDRAQQLRALAYSLNGDHTKALAILGDLPPSAETGGLTGGVLKRRYLETRNPNLLRRAHLEYSSAFERTNEHYPGINAAATAAWLNDTEKSRELAAKVRDIVLAIPEGKRDHWDFASLAQAELLLGDLEQAELHYQRATAKNPDGARAIASMRTDARLILRQQGGAGNELDQLLFVGGVACVTGHRVDASNAPTKRFPRSKVGAVTRKVRDTLEQLNIHFGYCSGASGADLIFAESLLDRGGEVTLVLPFPAQDFLGTSVGPDSKEQFKRVLERIPSSRQIVIHDKTPPADNGKNAAYARCNEVLQQQASDTARMLGERPTLVAVVVPAGGKVPQGGTADAIQLWQERVRGELVEINPLELEE